jgi:hypothetical protein
MSICISKKGFLWNFFFWSFEFEDLFFYGDWDEDEGKSSPHDISVDIMGWIVERVN